MACGFADDFKTADDCILSPLISDEWFTTHSCEVLLNDVRRSRMSARYALSFDIDWLRGRKNSVTTIGIAAAFNGSTADQIHRAAKNLLQLELHIDKLQQAAVLVFFRGEGAEQVHVAVRAEIIAQRRAEQFQPGHSALAAKPADRFVDVKKFYGTDFFFSTGAYRSAADNLVEPQLRADRAGAHLTLLQGWSV